MKKIIIYLIILFNFTACSFSKNQSKNKTWYRSSFRRILLDFHIEDWDASFLSQFDPKEFASCVKLANAKSATVFANTHTGLCNYPTNIGEMHGCLKGRDLLKEMIDQCHQNQIDAIVYYCLLSLFSN